MLRYALYASITLMLGCASLQDVPEQTRPLPVKPKQLCRGFIFKSALGESRMLCCLQTLRPVPITKCMMMEPETLPDPALNPDTLMRLGV